MSMVWMVNKNLLDNSFKIRQAAKTLFIRKTGRHLLVALIYVDDIMFEATCDSLSHEFAKEMKHILKWVWLVS